MTDVRDLTAVVTGASSGTGARLAVRLHDAGARVIVLGRSHTRTVEVAEAIGAPAVLVDHGDLESVVGAARTVRAHTDRVDLLFSNAGAARTERTPTVDGHEPNLQVNCLAPVLLERLLGPALGDGGRIVSTSSRSHLGAHLDAEHLGDQLDDASAGSHDRYARAKLALLLVHAAGRRRAPTPVVVDVHPGIVASGFGRYLGSVGAALTVVAKPFLRSPDTAARMLLDVARGNPSDTWYLHGTSPHRPNPLVEDDRLQDAVDALVTERLRPFLPTP